jgi:hypothetical protein
MKPSGKRAGAWPRAASPSSDLAGDAIPNAENPASFAKCRRENFPNIAFSRQVCFRRHRPFAGCNV